MTGLEKMFGSNDGTEPSARTSPLRGSMATKAPGSPPPTDLSACCAALLEVEVERQLELLALHRLARAQRRPLLAAERVDLHAGRAVLATQVTVVGPLDPALTDERALVHAAEAGELELLGQIWPTVPKSCAATSRCG